MLSAQSSLKTKKNREAQDKELHLRVEVLKSSRPNIVAKIDRLKAWQVELCKELQLVGSILESEEAAATP